MAGMAIEPNKLYIGTWTTAWGPMGGLRSNLGLRKLILPHYERPALRDLLAWEHEGATVDDDAFADVAGLCRDYFNGQRTDFTGLPCDLTGVGPFGQRILEACRRIPYGQTVSYTQLAALAGEEGKQRAVGGAMARNPIPLVIPCHRVKGAGGKLHGFSAPGGIDVKRRLLELEARVGPA